MTEQEEKDLIALLQVSANALKQQRLMVLAMTEAFKLIATDPDISLDDCKAVAREVLERADC